MASIKTNLYDDQRGSVSLWNLFWLTGFCAVMGLAVDISAAMNSKARLQTVADAASHAGVMDIFPVATGAIPTAVDYGGNNIPQHGNVVLGDDVAIGRWDAETRTFDTAPTAPYNAVRVAANRNSVRDNQLFTSFLAVIGFRQWDIGAEATAAIGGLSLVDSCRKGAMIAGGLMEQTSINTITGELCMHGEEQFKINENNVITCGVEMSTPYPENWMTGAAPVPTEGPCNDDYQNLTNDEMIAQAFQYRHVPIVAEIEYRNMKMMLDNFVAGIKINDPFSSIPSYISTHQTIDRNSFQSAVANGSLTPGTLYVVSCADGGGGNPLVMKGIVQNIGVYTDCEINVKVDHTVSDEHPERTMTGLPPNCDPDKQLCDNVDWMAEVEQGLWSCDALVAAGYETYETLLDTAAGKTYRDGVTTDTFAETCTIEPGANGLWDNVFVFTTANEAGNRNLTSISFPRHIQLGRMDGCTEGGGVRVYAGGSVHTPSGTIINGLQVTALGSVFLAAKADGVMGIMVEAMQDIKYTAGGAVGGCGINEEDHSSDVVLTVRPIAIVN